MSNIISYMKFHGTIPLFFSNYRIIQELVPSLFQSSLTGSSFMIKFRHIFFGFERLDIPWIIVIN